MTHRDFSRNASSSRAIPVKRMIENIHANPAMPLFWGKNQKGMQASEECNERVHVYGWGGGTDRAREAAWSLAKDNALKAAEAFDDAGYHKQVVNRLLEPFMHIKVVVSATKWNNFFTLRLHKDAEPHIQLLAQRIKKAMDASTPQTLGEGEWHLPYVTPEEYEGAYASDDKDWLVKLRQISTARCARVSYNNFEGKRPTLKEDLVLYERLVGSQPLHASPAEHQAMVDNRKTWPRQLQPLGGNFHGDWVQHRKLLPGEYVS